METQIRAEPAGVTVTGRDLAHPIDNVVAGRKSAPCASDNYDPDRIVAAAFFRKVNETFDHLPRDGIEALGPVERRGGDTAGAMKTQSFDIPHWLAPIRL